MNRQSLIDQIKHKRSFLCIGLDSDITKIPAFLNGDVLAFNRAIVQATSSYCVAYKINTAFYESIGEEGWRMLTETIKLIPKDIMVIADAKRGDIGNTSTQYAKAFFDEMHCDALTIAPYMGHDSVKPFLDFEDKWAIVLGLTSNAGSHDFQFLETNGKYLYEQVIETVAGWGTPGNMMFVIGATHPEDFKRVREIVPEHFLLVPGVGAQGGDLHEVCKYGLNKDIGLLVNSSRGIIFAGNEKEFAEKAAGKARGIQMEMNLILSDHQL
jgi:orotidine-5'-phosphate decarboxylase